MMYQRAKGPGSLLLAVLFAIAMSSTPALGAAAPPPLGTINYIEGNASINGHALTEKSVGSTVLKAGQTLSTQDGRAEILLTPGIFFRVDDHSAAQMISPGLADTVMAVQTGRAMVEVAEIHAANNVQVVENGVNTQLLKEGLYDFDAGHGQIRVFDGKAVALVGDRQIDIKGGHELTLAGAGKLKAQKFDKDQYAGDFYRWSSLRSSYLAEANVDAARKYVVAGGYAPGLWYGDGWYWDPAFAAYTFIPGDGIFYDPFGWGFFSPGFVFGAPYFVYGYPHGFYHHHFGPAYRPLHSMNRNAVGTTGHAFHVGSGRSGSISRGGGFARGPAMGGFRGAGGFHAGGGFRGAPHRGR